MALINQTPGVSFDSQLHETIEGVGYAFSSGCMASGIMYFALGCYYSPRGFRRIYGGLCHARDRTTAFGGSIAMWSFLFNSSKGMMAYAR